HDGSGPEMKAAPQSRWRRAWLVYTRPSALRMLFLGFSAGLPFMLVFATLTAWLRDRSEEHTSELQSRFDLVCRLLLEKKKCILQDTGKVGEHKARSMDERMRDTGRTPHPADP